MLRSTVLPRVASWCSERTLQLRVHPWWPEDTAQHPDEQPEDFAQTPVGKIRDLVIDEDVFIFAIIGPDVPGADIALLKFIWSARPGYDRRVRFVILPRPGGDADAVRLLFAELSPGADVAGYRDPTPHRLEEDLIRWLGEGLSMDSRDPEPATPSAEPDRGRTPAAVVDENVQFTVYRPNAVQPKVWYPLLAFAHLAERRPDAPPGQPDPLEQVQELAAQALGEEAAYGAPRVDARGGVPREGQLTFAPFVEGVDFNPRSQTFEWQEDVHQQNFRLKARPDTAGRVLRGQLTVYLGAFILADIDLTFRVDLAAPSPPTPTVRGASLSTSSASQTSPQPELTPATAVPYQNVFPSYSHKDLAIVRQAEVYGRALGHVYLRDRLALRSGEEWEVRLLELIDQADIFQLFWSSNSMNSEYVRREWEHAQALGRRGFIRPTYWEVPMPQSNNPRLPPDELAKLHFHGFSEEVNDEDFASTRSPAIPLSDYEEWARRRAVEKALSPPNAPSPSTEPAGGWPHASAPSASAEPAGGWPDASAPSPSAEPPRVSPHAGSPSPPQARRTRRLWLIVAVLAVLVALAVVFLLRG